MSRIAAGVFIFLIIPSAAVAQFGSTLSGLGPVNRSMGGAATAAPLDAVGALQWNPATITALPSSMDFGLELLLPHSKLASGIPADSLGQGLPQVDLSGVTRSDNNVFPLPEFGLIHNAQDSPLAFGLGVLSVGGFGVNYPGSGTNPLLTPPLPNGLGVGPVHTQYQLLQVVPTVAVQVTERFSIGFSPIVDLAGLSADPGIVAAPDNANGNGFPTYPPLNHGTFQWGAGFQVGAYYVTETCWQLGASFRSTQWFNDFEYNTRDQIGAPRNVQFGFDAPMIVSLGTAYSGIDRLLLAVDARYFNYEDTRGYSDSGFAADGSVAGLGWSDVFAVSTGVQYLLTDAASVRAGYSFSTNPVGDDQTFFNIGSPLSLQHGVSVGASYNLTPRCRISLACSHFFENSISGPIYGAAGPIPGTSVTSSTSADAITCGVSVRY